MASDTTKSIQSFFKYKEPAGGGDAAGVYDQDDDELHASNSTAGAAAVNSKTGTDFTLQDENADDDASTSNMHQEDAESDATRDYYTTMAASSSSVNKERCEKCGQQVSPFEMPEHLDYHLAKELQAQLSREENNQNRRNEPLVAKVAAAPKNKRKGRPSSAAAQNVIIPPDAKKQKTISSFFGKK